MDKDNILTEIIQVVERRLPTYPGFEIYLKAQIGEILNAQEQEDNKKEEEYQRLLYWVLMDLTQGIKCAWNGKFVYDHEQGLARFVNKYTVEASDEAS